jgi:hypothetical protein
VSADERAPCGRSAECAGAERRGGAHAESPERAHAERRSTRARDGESPERASFGETRAADARAARAAEYAESRLGCGAERAERASRAVEAVGEPARLVRSALARSRSAPVGRTVGTALAPDGTAFGPALDRAETAGGPTGVEPPVGELAVERISGDTSAAGAERARAVVGRRPPGTALGAAGSPPVVRLGGPPQRALGRAAKCPLGGSSLARRRTDPPVTGR